MRYSAGMSSPAFKEPAAAVPPTPLDHVDALVARVASQKDVWLKVGLVDRIALLRRCQEGVLAVAEEWVRGGCELKGIAPGDPLEGEEWLAGPMTTLRNIRLLIETLEAGGQPTPRAVRERGDGQKVAAVFPADARDQLLFGGFTAEVWIQKGKPASQGKIYREPPRAPGKVALVLGAGNVSSIPPMDFLYKLFAENEVVVCKMNPVNAHVGAKLERAFKPLIDDGYLAICYGGAQVGAHLAEHPLIDSLHITGSDRSYDAIVWGADPDEQKRRKAMNQPKNAKPFTAELGCVTPVLVVPGPWSEGDLAFQARHVAGMVVQNGSFNCNAAKVLVTARGWSERGRFLGHVDAALERTPARKAYYPGARDRYQGFVDRYPAARRLGPDAPDVVPWTVIPDVPARDGEYALTTEAFCGILAETDVDTADPAVFLREAVALANERLWGTLSCCLLVHPATAKSHARELDQAIADLRYGGIGVNVWPGLLYGLVSPTWGAYPGHTAQAIQSGTGVVHNSFLFDYPEKSVLRAPFRIRPTPVWFPDHKTLAVVGRRITELEAAPSWLGAARVAIAALRG